MLTRRRVTIGLLILALAVDVLLWVIAARDSNHNLAGWVHLGPALLAGPLAALLIWDVPANWIGRGAAGIALALLVNGLGFFGASATVEPAAFTSSVDFGVLENAPPIVIMDAPDGETMTCPEAAKEPCDAFHRDRGGTVTYGYEQTPEVVAEKTALAAEINQPCSLAQAVCLDLGQVTAGLLLWRGVQVGALAIALSIVFRLSKRRAVPVSADARPDSTAGTDQPSPYIALWALALPLVWLVAERVLSPPSTAAHNGVADDIFALILWGGVPSVVTFFMLTGSKATRSTNSRAVAFIVAWQGAMLLLMVLYSLAWRNG